MATEFSCSMRSFQACVASWMELLSHTSYFDQQARGCKYIYIVHIFSLFDWYAVDNCRAALVGNWSNVVVYMKPLLHVPAIVICYGYSTHSFFPPCAPTATTQQVVLMFVGCMRPSRTFHTRFVRDNVRMVFATTSHSAIFILLLFRCHTRTK